MSQSHDRSTRSQPLKTINWVFYHPKHLERQDVCTPYLYIIKEDDLDQFMLTWIPKAFAGDIRRIYGFNPDEYSIRVAQVFLSKQLRSNWIDGNWQPNTVVDIIDVDRKWASNITNLETCVKFIPSGFRVKELIDMLGLGATNATGRHLHLVVTAQCTEMGQGDKGEAQDTAGDINQTYARIITCFSGEFRLTHNFTRLLHFSS